MRRLADCPVFPTLDEFYDNDTRRRFSPEWDYGVMWRLSSDVRSSPFPQFRVSWIVDTGDLYAYSPHVGVIMLGNIGRVGEYPHSGGLTAWSQFNRAQPVEDLLDGWAEPDVNTLQWILDRLDSLPVAAR